MNNSVVGSHRVFVRPKEIIRIVFISFSKTIRVTSVFRFNLRVYFLSPLRRINIQRELLFCWSPVSRTSHILGEIPIRGRNVLITVKKPRFSEQLTRLKITTLQSATLCPPNTRTHVWRREQGPARSEHPELRVPYLLQPHCVAAGAVRSAVCTTARGTFNV